MIGNRLLGVFLSFVCTTLSSAAFAYDEPVVNLGYTSFLDGGPPSGPGLYVQNYSQYYTVKKLTDKRGMRLPFPRNDLNVTADILQLVYVSKKKILGANLGMSALLPWLIRARVHDGLQQHVLRAADGSGDLFIGPALQFDPIMRKDGKGPRFVQRFDLDIIVPVGHFDKKYAVNPSSNFWSLAPYWAVTYWFTPKWDLSYRLHYLWNAINHRPNASFGPTVYATQAGQAVYADIATDYAVTEKLHLGINSYFFYQFKDTRVNDVSVPGRREKVWALGPGMLYGFTKNQFLFFNLYFEGDARNRPQGTNFILRYVIHF